MSLSLDAEVIEQTVRQRDLAFHAVDPDRIAAGLITLRQLAASGDLCAFLLAAMRLMALPGNGHTRLIPNPAASTLPLRFVALGSGIYLTDGARDHAGPMPSRLLAVNGYPVEEVLAKAQPYLAGTRARQRVIGAILFAWPAALRALGAAQGGEPIAYTLGLPTGERLTLRVDMSVRVPGSTYYPASEHGAATTSTPEDGWATCEPFGSGVFHLRLPSFYCPESNALEEALARTARSVLSEPDRNLIVDLRGNTGGDFLKAVPLIDRLAEGWRGDRFALLVDKFTFSAAIVFASLASRRLPGTCRIAGEEMGDETRFHAEGGSLTLPFTGATLRYSDAYHDWETGQAAPSTPPEIARHLVAAGPMRPDIPVDITLADLAGGRDPALLAAADFAAG